MSLARDDLDLSAQLGYLLRAVEELTSESKFLRNDLKAHMEEEVEIKRAMDERVAKLENDLSRAKGFLIAVTGMGAFIGTLAGQIIDKVF